MSCLCLTDYHATFMFPMKFKILKAMSIIIIIIRSLKGKHLKKPFIDKLRVFVKAGNGGIGNGKLGGIGGDG